MLAEAHGGDEGVSTLWANQISRRTLHMVSSGPSHVAVDIPLFEYPSALETDLLEHPVNASQRSQATSASAHRSGYGAEASSTTSFRQS